MTGLCKSYCEHGGVCELDAGHDGLHDSRYCQWDDDHAVPKQQADDELVTKTGDYGRTIIGLTDLFKGLGDEATP